MWLRIVTLLLKTWVDRMNKNELKASVYAILGTLAECGGSSPASHLYLCVGADMQAWEAVRNILVSAGLVTIAPSRLVSLTPKGQTMGEAINQAMADVAAERSAAV